MRCHEAAFTAFGGVPRTLLYDNLKAVVLEREGDVIRFNPRFLCFAGHYHFNPLPVARARGNEKGRVERAIRYLRESFFAARRFHDVAHLNHLLGEWIAHTAHARLVPDDPEGRAVSVALEHERPLLMPLPKHPAACEHLRPVVSGKTPYVRFDGNLCSIPHTLVRRPLTLAASETRVRVLDGDAEVAVHERARGRRSARSRSPRTSTRSPTTDVTRASTADATACSPRAAPPRASSRPSRCTVATSAAPPLGCCVCSTSTAPRPSPPRSERPPRATRSRRSPSRTSSRSACASGTRCPGCRRSSPTIRAFATSSSRRARSTPTTRSPPSPTRRRRRDARAPRAHARPRP
ncbi:MAG: transposase, partial [Polyangiaceae bacterium]|nr:transposase [Polyangiaceae bacterium]